MAQGWFEVLQSKPIQRTPEQLEADAWFLSEKARLQEERRQKEQVEAQERAAAETAVAKRSCVARLSQIDLSIARSRHEEWNLLTTGKPEGATY